MNKKKLLVLVSLSILLSACSRVWIDPAKVGVAVDYSQKDENGKPKVEVAENAIQEVLDLLFYLVQKNMEENPQDYDL